MDNPGNRNINCEEALHRVFDYIDHNLGEKSRDELERHLESCRHCFDRIEFEKQLKLRLRNLKPDVSTEMLHHRIGMILEQY